MSNTYGTDAVGRVLVWQDLINHNKKGTDLEKIRLVTDFFNAVPYHTDQEVWHVANYWANPLEFLGKYAGDCEDYAIAKYLTLKAMGVSPDKMRIVYVVSKKLNAPHMILAYYETNHAEPLILDNMTPQILYASDRPDLKPVYMFSEDAIWMTDGNAAPKEVISGSQILAWKQLIMRMQNAGLPEDDLKP
ncbi:MAG: transglutaminase-like cysteine peptidase [Gammaproteobacteria bacterium]